MTDLAKCAGRDCPQCAALRADLAAVRAELAAAKQENAALLQVGPKIVAERDDAVRDLATAKARIAELEEQNSRHVCGGPDLAAAKADAERYRWLRVHIHNIVLPKLNELDTAIDAAIGSK